MGVGLRRGETAFKGMFCRIWERSSTQLAPYHFPRPVYLHSNLGNLDLEVMFCLHLGILHDLVNSESRMINSLELSGMTMFVKFYKWTLWLIIKLSSLSRSWTTIPPTSKANSHSYKSWEDWFNVFFILIINRLYWFSPWIPEKLYTQRRQMMIYKINSLRISLTLMNTFSYCL